MRDPSKALVRNKAEGIAAKRTYAEKVGTVRKSIRVAMDNDDIQQVWDELTDLERAFCQEYIKDFNASQAVARAGSQSGNPHKVGSAMRAKPHIRLMIDHLLKERADNFEVKPDYVLRKLIRTIEKTESEDNHTATLRGLELLARHLGMFVDKTEITGAGGEAIKYEKMEQDAADLTNAIARLAKRGGEGGVAEGSEP